MPGGSIGLYFSLVYVSWSHLTAATVSGELNVTLVPVSSTKRPPKFWITFVIKPWPSPLRLIVIPQPQTSLLGSETLSAASRRSSRVSILVTSTPAASNRSLRANHPPDSLRNGTAHHLSSIKALRLAPTGTTSPYLAIAASTTSVTSSTMSRKCICG